MFLGGTSGGLKRGLALRQDRRWWSGTTPATSPVMCAVGGGVRCWWMTTLAGSAKLGTGRAEADSSQQEARRADADARVGGASTCRRGAPGQAVPWASQTSQTSQSSAEGAERSACRPAAFPLRLHYCRSQKLLLCCAELTRPAAIAWAGTGLRHRRGVQVRPRMRARCWWAEAAGVARVAPGGFAGPGMGTGLGLSAAGWKDGLFLGWALAAGLGLGVAARERMAGGQSRASSTASRRALAWLLACRLGVDRRRQ